MSLFLAASPSPSPSPGKPEPESNLSHLVHDVETGIMDQVKLYAPRVIGSIIIILIFYWISTYYVPVKPEKTDKIVKQKLMEYEMAYIRYYGIIFVGVLIGILNLRIQTSMLLTVLGSAGIAVALSLQGVLGHITAGIYISVNTLFDIGETIEVSSGPKVYRGIVKDFNFFNTTLFGVDVTTTTVAIPPSPIVIPNSFIQSGIVTKID